ncbi:MAG: hypothetical protein WC807_18590 [Hyphomicrobium sp.]|jgi:hypothetical protein
MPIERDAGVESMGEDVMFTACATGASPALRALDDASPICGGCLKPIEKDAQGRLSYSAMMRLDGGPADRVHTSSDCKRLYEINERQRRIEHEEAKISDLRGAQEGEYVTPSQSKALHAAANEIAGYVPATSTESTEEVGK